MVVPSLISEFYCLGKSYWSPWVEAVPCSVSCGLGHTEILRTCSVHGECPGANRKSLDCHLKDCDNGASENAEFGGFRNGSKKFLVLGGNQDFRTDVEILAAYKTPSICSKPADIPDKFSKGAIGAYFNGKVLLCGGWMAGKECNEYKLTRHQWRPVSYSLTTERSEAAGAMLQNGSWIVIGGKGLDETPLFSTEIFNNGLFAPNFLWPEAISGHCLKQLNNSHIFVAGGEGFGAILDSIYFLNVDSSFWFSLEKRLMYKRRGHVCGIIGNGNRVENIVIAGGQGILETEILDMKSLRLKHGPRLPFEMDWAASIEIGSTFAIVGGRHFGYCSKPGLCVSSNALFEVDIEHNLWKVHEKTLALSRARHIVVEVDDAILPHLCQDNCPSCKGRVDCKMDYYMYQSDK